MSALVASSMSGSAITSETANRPPGRSTRAASRRTLGLSPERLITQLEITTSTVCVGERHVLEVALDELDVLDAGLGGVGAGELEHLVGHVEPDRSTGRGDSTGGDQDVGAGARAEIEHRLAFAQVGDGGRHAAAERGVDGGFGNLLAAGFVVESGSENACVVHGGASGVSEAQQPDSDSSARACS